MLRIEPRDGVRLPHRARCHKALGDAVAADAKCRLPWAGYSYGLDARAAYWLTYERLCHLWANRHSHHFRSQHHEVLVAEPGPQIHAAFDFCELTFEPGCLNFHQTRWTLRTPSALQVRQAAACVHAGIWPWGAA